MGDCLLSIEQKFKDNVSLRCILCTFKGKRAKKKRKIKPKEVLLEGWSNHAACNVIIPQPGSESTPSAVKTESLHHWTTKEYQAKLFFKCF